MRAAHPGRSEAERPLAVCAHITKPPPIPAKADHRQQASLFIWEPLLPGVWPSWIASRMSSTPTRSLPACSRYFSPVALPKGARTSFRYFKCYLRGDEHQIFLGAAGENSPAAAAACELRMEKSHSTALTPRHFGKVAQPQKWLPMFAPYLAVRLIIGLRHKGQAGSVAGAGTAMTGLDTSAEHA